MTLPMAGRALVVLAVGALLLPARAARAECAVDALCAPADDPCVVTGTHEIDDGCLLAFGTRAVLLSGTLKAGISGGSFTIGSGPFTLDGGALRAHGSSGAAGGTIEVTAQGPFVMVPSSPIIEVDGANGGGTVRIFATAIDLGTGTITADGTTGSATGGTVQLSASGAAPLVLDGAITAQGRGGADSDGGIVDVVGASIAVRATINTSGSGSDGGPIMLRATAGDVTIASTAVLNARAGNADQSGGTGGMIDLDATGSIVVGGPVHSEGPGPDGSGGDIGLQAGQSVRIDDTLTTTGSGSESSGGDIVIDAGTTVEINARLDTSATGGDGTAGDMDIDAFGDLTIAAGVTVAANSGAFGAGDLSMVSRSVLRIAGTLVASASNGGAGGNIGVVGCTVMIDGTLDAGGASTPEAGLTRLTAGALTIGPTAHLRANPGAVPLDGFASSNGLRLRAGSPTIDPAAEIAPGLEVHVEATITPCCGNGGLDAGEICDDGNIRYCDGCAPTCLPEPPCPGDGNACTTDCDPAAGCVYTPLTDTPCPGDGSVCTADVCVDGTCSHPLLTCDDGIACTLDACDPLAGCQSAPDDALCDDGDVCTDDVCSPVDGCASAPRPDASPCDDHDLCTRDDACLGGQCVGAGISLECDDGNPCTVDRCDPTFGCLNEEDATACPCTVGGSPLPVGAPCVDGDLCSSPDTCDGAGHCIGGPLCDDGDPCTTDTCFLACVHTDDRCPVSCAGKPDGTPCSDDLVCTVGICQGGSCTSTPRDCGDEVACDGIDFCNAFLGCRSSYPPTSDPRCFTTVLDAFGCYKAKTAIGTAHFEPVSGLAVDSGLDAFAADVVKMRSLCLPTSYAGADPLAPLHEDHLLSYKLRAAVGSPIFVRHTGLPLLNQLGTFVIDAVGRQDLLVPAAMSLGAPPGEPVPPSPDAFACYKTRTSPGSPAFAPIADVAVADVFGIVHVALTKPTRVCAPASIATEDPAAAGHATYLLCYKAKAVGSSVLPRVVSVNDRFPAQTLYLSKREEVCLPSARTDLAPP